MPTKFRIVIILLLITLTLFPGKGGAFTSSSQTPFSDVEEHWASMEIGTLFKEGIIKGYPDGSFKPDEPIKKKDAFTLLSRLKERNLSLSWADLSARDESYLSRGEGAEILKKLFYAKISIACDPSFPDVPSDHPFFSSIEALHQLGIIQGDGQSFYPDELLSRAQFCVLLCRLLNHDKVSLALENEEVEMSIFPYKVLQGEILTLAVSSPEDYTCQVEWLGEIYQVRKGENYLPVPIDLEEGNYEIKIFAEDGLSETIFVKVIPNSHLVEEINLPPESLQLLSSDLLSIERERLYSVLDNPSPYFPPLTFSLPIETPILSPFGAERFYPNWGSDYHWGIDFQGELGHEVKASSRGVVVLAEELYSRGRTVVIDHGGSIFTLYYHLSEINKAVGDRVEEGDLIGHVGATGSVTGPHLHWEARLGRIPFNPLILLRGSK